MSDYLTDLTDLSHDEVLDEMRYIFAVGELNRLAKLRAIQAADRLRITQPETARHIGVSQAQVSRLVAQLRREPDSTRVTVKEILWKRAARVITDQQMLGILMSWNWNLTNLGTDGGELLTGHQAGLITTDELAAVRSHINELHQQSD